MSGATSDARDKDGLESLKDRWILDLQRGFCAAQLLSVGGDKAVSLKVWPYRLAAEVLSGIQGDDDVREASDSTLNLLASIHEDIASPRRRSVESDHPDLGHQKRLAEIEIGRRRGSAEVQGKAARTATLSHLVMQLHQGDLTIERILRWFGFIDQAHETVVRALILEIRSCEGTSGFLAQQMASAREVNSPVAERVRAVDLVFDKVSALIKKVREDSDDGGHGFKSGWWIRTCIAWRSSLYSWPIMWGGGSELAASGMGLPFLLRLEFDGRSGVSMAGKPKYLRWTNEWANSFNIAMRAAKELWRSQNGRIRIADEDDFVEHLDASLIVDVALADEVVAALYASGGKVCELNGPSAQAYWAIAILGLLNGTGANLNGAATGRLVRADGAWYLRSVGNIRQKLHFANAHGHTRLVIPGQEEEEDSPDMDECRKEGDREEQGRRLDAVREDAARDYLEFRDDLRASNVQLRLELNLCTDLRTAADALSTSGWRRARFVRLPEMQSAFSYSLRRLFFHENPKAHAEEKNQDFLSRQAWSEDEEKELDKLRTFILGDKNEGSPVRFISRKDLEVELGRQRRLARGRGARPIPFLVEAALGKWLAWEDHCRRQPGVDRQPSLPGLGVTALKTMPGESNERLWALVASEFEASKDWYSRFRWAEPERSATELAELLNNVPLNTDISGSAPPDILVVFDEAGVTQNPKNPEIPTDRVGSWMEIMNPNWHGPARTDALSEALTASRSGLGIRGCRVLVVHGERVQGQELVEGLSSPQLELLEKLAVFRFTFSEQAGFHLNRPTENSKSEKDIWLDYQHLLDCLRKANVIRQTKGRLYVKPSLLASLRGAGRNEDWSKPWWQPKMHERAAEALCPIVQPSFDYRSQNRDIGVSPEANLEAMFHISKAIARTHQQETNSRRRRRKIAQSLALLQRFPGWDTVGRLRDSVLSLEAYEIANDLLERQKSLASDGTVDIRNARPGSLLAVISQLRPNAGLSTNYLLQRCNDIFFEFLDVDRVGVRLANRVAANYVLAVKKLGGKPAVEAFELLENAVSDVEQDDFLEAGDSRALDCSMPFPWWRQYSGVDNPKERRRRLRLEIRASVRRYLAVSTSPLHYDAWVDFFAIDGNEPFDRDVQEALRLWNRSVRTDPTHRARFSVNLRGRSARRQSSTLKRTPHADALHKGGRLLMKLIKSPNNSVDLDILEAASNYLSDLNFSDRSLGYDLIVDGPSMDIRLLDWVNSRPQLRAVVRQIVTNSGVWVAMMTRDEAPNVRFVRILEALKARRNLIQDKGVLVDQSGDCPLSPAEKDLWMSALEELGKLEIFGDLAEELEQVSRSLRQDLS